MPVTYTVIIPLKNEEESIGDLIQELASVMHGLKAPWEVICVEDGSTDKTFEVLTRLQKNKPELKILQFDRNYGQSSAFDAGFRAAQGEWVITLDGDGQNDPADIPKLIQASLDYDLVCGQRVNRKDPWHKKITSKLANIVRKVICEDGVHDTGCSLKLYRAKALKQIRMYQGMHRFLPALFLIEGFRIKEVPVNHRERMRGKTKYNFLNRSFNTIADMFAVRWMRKRRLHYKVQE